MMKKRIYLTLWVIGWAIVAGAQTADHTATTVQWTMTSGTTTEMAGITPADASQFFAETVIVTGSGIGTPVAKTSEIGSITQTLFPVSTKTSGANDNNGVTFLITLKEGISFTPTSVSFKAFRWKTDKGNFDVSWHSDGTQKTLATGVHPNRGAGSGAGSVSEYHYDLSGMDASERQLGLVVNIYNFDVAADKGLSLGEVCIEGTLYGTVGQPLSYALTVNVSPEGAGSVEVSPAGPTYKSGTLVTLSQQPAEGYLFNGWTTETGKVLSTADNYSLTMKGNKTITASYVKEESLMVNDYIVVENQAQLRAAIRKVNEEQSSQRRFIFLKNGTYDYGEYNNPESGADPYGRDTIKADNISLIGQSAEGVVVTITPKQASVSRTAPLVITATGSYLQDFTLHNNFSYGGDDGQAAALMDKGHHTIGKNMRLVSRQDTYYSNTDNGQLYFEDSHFEGTVDFICGRGDVFFNHCDLVCVNRYPNSGDNKGDTHIAAPYTIAENFDDAGGHGYIFNGCTVDCLSQTWDFGRGWRGWPKMAFLNTTLSPQAALRLGTDQTKGKAIDYSLRVTTKGIQSSSDSHYLQFHEYNTTDEAGQLLSPASNVLEFTASDKKSYETILQASETERFQLRNVFPDWTPDELCRQVVVTKCQLEGNTLSWTSDRQAKAFLIERDNEFVALVDGTQQHYDMADISGTITVRAANRMGGFGLPTAVGEQPTGISRVDADVVPTDSQQAFFDLQGRRVAHPQKGLYIIRNKKIIIP